MQDLNYLPLVNRPFNDLAKRLNITENDLISKLKIYMEKGYVRRFGAVLDHRKIGFTVNALVVWNVKEDDLESAGSIMSTYSQVSHCYTRDSYEDWPYNLYTMIHSNNKKGIDNIVKEISQKTRQLEYKILTTIKEFKKSRPVLNEKKIII